MKTTHILLSVAAVAVAGTAGYLLYKKYYAGAIATPLPKYIVPGSNIVLPTGPLTKTLPSTAPVGVTMQKILDSIATVVNTPTPTRSPTTITKGTSIPSTSQPSTQQKYLEGIEASLVL